MTSMSQEELAQVIAQAVAAALAAQNAPKPSVVHSPEEYEKTGANTHRATQRGHAAGELLEEGDFVPAGVAVSDAWMRPVAAKDRKVEAAVLEAQDPSPKDVDLTKLSKAALEAMAAERGVNVAGLGKDDLITAIRAEREPTI